MQPKQIDPRKARRLARLGAWSLGAAVSLLLGVAPALAQTSEAGWMIVTGKWSKGAVDAPAWFDLASWRLVTKFEGSVPWPIPDPDPNPWYPVAGDFNGDGIDEVMMFNRVTWEVVPASNGPITVAGDPQPQPWVPVAGNWDGKGIATLQVFDQRDASLHKLSERLWVSHYDPDPNPWRPQVGNFDGRGLDTVAHWRLNPNDAAGKAWVQVAGDWDGDGVDTFGAISASTGELAAADRLALKAAARPHPVSLDVVTNGGCYTTTKNYGESVHVVNLGGACMYIVISTWEDWSCCSQTSSPAGPYACGKTLRIKSSVSTGSC